MADNCPLLLVVAHGVGARELTEIDATALDLPRAAPVELPSDPVRTLAFECDASDALADLGVAVDRRSLLLRPRGRTDATAIERLAERPTGPAPVTVFESTGVLDAAVVGGIRAAAAAARQLGDTLAAARSRLRRGDPPEVWFVGLGSAAPVGAMFDFAAAWRRRVAAPLARDLRVEMAAGAVRIAGANHRALQLAASVLACAPFDRHGEATAPSRGEVVFRARAGTAFGERPVAARATNTRTSTGVFAAPVGDTARRGGLAFAELLARFWMRAALLLAGEDRPAPRADRSAQVTAAQPLPATPV